MRRAEFEAAYPAEHPLRRLACRISRAEAAPFQARANPANLLVNGATGPAWHRPRAWDASTLAEWKGRTARGTALLFDPFVDSFLATHCLPGGTVLVLSDYYPLHKSIPENYAGDWGEEETRAAISGKTNRGDQTRPRLFTALAGHAGWHEEPSLIRRAAAEHRLLLWNFLPMFRGGLSAVDAAGLPPRGGLWVQICLGWLQEFCAVVQPRRVVLACSQGHLAIPCSVEPLAAPPLPCPTWRLNHPSSWRFGGAMDHGPLLTRLLREAH